MISKDKGNQVQVTSYYDPSAIAHLRALSETTRIPQAAYLREALDDVLSKHTGKVTMYCCFGEGFVAKNRGKPGTVEKWKSFQNLLDALSAELPDNVTMASFEVPGGQYVWEIRSPIWQFQKK
jgi:Ribbon-helix-helix domain